MSNRLTKIKDELQKQKFDAILVSSIPNITYLTGFSGFSAEEREAFILITKNAQYILTDKRYKDEIKNYITDLKLEEVSSTIPYRIALEKLIKKHKIKKLGVEETNIKVSEYKSLLKILPSSSLINFGIDENRSVKDQNEINVIQKACKLTDQAFVYILKKIKPGITEKELADDLEFFIKKHGAELAFPSIVAFGKHSAVPHHNSNNEKLKTKDIILLDFGAKVPASPSQGGGNYCSDMTRVVFLGKATDEQKKVYEIVLEAQKQAMDFLNHKSYILNQNIKAFDVDKAAHDYIRKKGFGKNIFHSLGHGVGLEIHEAPRLSPKSKEILKPNMVFTIEPGIYLPNKFGIRIEDTVVLEGKGLKILTKSSKEISEL